MKNMKNTTNNTLKTRRITALIIIFTLLHGCSKAAYEQKKGKVNANLNGIELPENYKDWKVLSASHRIDNSTMRIILGNDIAIKASRNNQTNPWPNGSIIGKLVFKQKTESNWSTAIAPDESKFIHAEFMFKDTNRFVNNGTGWGWARWLGDKQTPYGNKNDLNQSCIACHTPVKGNDWVFSTPIKLP